MLKPLFLSFLFILSLGLSACDTPTGFEVKTYEDADSLILKNQRRQTTGHREVIQTPAPTPNQQPSYRILQYTPSGNLDSYEKLAEEERSSAKHSPEFAQSINAAYISQKIEGNTHRFQIELDISKFSERLMFEYSVNSTDIRNKHYTKSSTVTTDGFQYEIAGQCENTNCTILKLTLFKIKENTIEAQTSLMYTVTTTRVRAIVAHSEGSDEEFEINHGIVNRIQSQEIAKKETIAIVDGKSSTTVTLMDPQTPEKKLLTIQAPVAETYEQSIEANHVEHDDKTTEVRKAQLQGSNPESGALAVDFTITDLNGRAPQRVRLYVQESKDLDETSGESSPAINPEGPSSDRPRPEATTDEVLSKYSKAVFPILSKEVHPSQVPGTITITKRLETYKNHNITKNYIGMWTQRNHPRVGFCNKSTYYTQNRATNFLTQMNTPIQDKNHSLGELTSLILNKIDAMPQMAYLGALEGNYWKDFNANIVVPYNRRAGQANVSKRYQYWSDASGPYGCLTDTCREIIRKNKPLLESAGLDLKVSYVTPMEREMFAAKLRQGVRETNIKRGTLRQEIFNSGRETEYARQRANGADLLDSDARKYFATATLLAGLEVKRLSSERRSYTQEGPSSQLPSRSTFRNEIRKDPALAVLAYHAGLGNLAKYAVCAQLDNENERNNCQRAMSLNTAYSKRHEGFDTTLSDITEFKMAPCNQLDYTWAWLALQFIGSQPSEYGIEIGIPSNNGLTYEALMPEGTQLSSLLGIGNTTLL